MTLKLVQSVGGCGTKQQTSRDDTVCCHDGSRGEDPVLDLVDCLKVNLHIMCSYLECKSQITREILIRSPYQLLEEVRDGRLGERERGVPDRVEMWLNTIKILPRTSQLFRNGLDNGGVAGQFPRDQPKRVETGVEAMERKEKGIRGNGHEIWEWRDKCRETEVLAGGEEIHERHPPKSPQALAYIMVKSPLCGNDL
ncbi:hypothetical protein E2C01_031559 [Portunus trituberculatus]|uniref:Uncharacterized protein n=1 Tax=Portunus trituberculatus TaxID=210409 RepID=A0A5B7EYF8_PORTR|nr:hypothetical protein [Portunus trituberculatus]